MKIWVLKDGRIGSSKQTDFLAKELSDDIVEKNIEYNRLIIIPNCIKPYSVGVDFEESDELLNLKIDEYPDVIIFAGRRLAGIAIYLKKYILRKFNKKVKLISILNPNYSFKHFTFVLLPQHDAEINDTYNNILKFEGSICKLDLTKLVDAKTKEYWNNELSNHRRPFFTLMVGGNTKNKKFDMVKFAEFLKYVSSFISKQKGTLLISTSRRTTDNYVKIMEKNLNCDYYMYKWGKSNLFNPYYFFINESEMAFLTGDSISMIAEIATVGKPIYVYMPEESLEKKHMAFCKSLLKKEVIKEANLSNGDNFKIFENKPINELNRLVKYIKTKLGDEK